MKLTAERMALIDKVLGALEGNDDEETTTRR